MAAVAIVKPLLSIHPGEWYFGAEYQRLHTVLGSCVALTAWHPRLKIGGMCHYLLALESGPEQVSVARDKNQSRIETDNGRYAGVALQHMKRAMKAYASIGEFQLGIFGGGDMFAYQTPTSIGHANIAFVRQWLAREKVKPAHIDVGGAISRSLMLVMPTGEIQLKLYDMSKPE